MTSVSSGPTGSVATSARPVRVTTESTSGNRLSTFSTSDPEALGLRDRHRRKPLDVERQLAFVEPRNELGAQPGAQSDRPAKEQQRARQHLLRTAP